MWLFRLTTYFLLWSISAPDVCDGNEQMTLLKAFQQVKNVPIILSVSRTPPRRYQGGNPDILKITSPSELQESAELNGDSHEMPKYNTKKSRAHSKVKYVVVKDGSFKKYHKRPFSSYAEYFGGPYKKEILYEDEDHTFIRVSSVKPRPQYAHVKMFHEPESESSKNCPFMPPQTHVQPLLSQDQHESPPQAPAPQDNHLVHNIGNINIFDQSQDREQREPPRYGNSVNPGGNHDRRHFLMIRPESTGLQHRRPPPHRAADNLNAHGPNSHAVYYHRDTGPPEASHHVPPQIELHVSNDRALKQQLHEPRRKPPAPHHFASTNFRKQQNRLPNHVPHDLYQPRFPDHQENPREEDPHQGHESRLFGAPATYKKKDRSNRRDPMVYAGAMNQDWPVREALMISDAKGNPLVYASPRETPPFSFRNSFRRRIGRNVIDLPFH
ncbi:uncharacterized protein LOC100899622 [Galendromus occidentalis]|uniref:Uncharacterized protein LOC100899622 n=1 Tax=Galendromus occidentalis TaxID=34638 RepID=A0AAJ6W022_9ACAR|nr:uncharacterized protein LOC100899622 [Galendromus occidentalis]